jgi:hypothetical protein
MAVSAEALSTYSQSADLPAICRACKLFCLSNLSNAEWLGCSRSSVQEVTVFRQFGASIARWASRHVNLQLQIVVSRPREALNCANWALVSMLTQ